MGTRYGGEALATDIGISDRLVFLDVFEQLIVTPEPVEGILGQGLVDAFTDAFFTAAVIFIEAGLLSGARVRFDHGGGEQAPDSAATALFGDQHIIETESPKSGYDRDMAVGPIADQFFLNPVMGGGNGDHFCAGFAEKFCQVEAQLFDQFIGFKVTDRPFRGTETIFAVRGGDGLWEREEK